TTSVPNSTTGISTTRVTVINTTTGAQIGTTAPITGGAVETRLMGTDGRRALVVTDASDAYHPTPAVHTTGMPVIDTSTGAQVGTTLSLTGKPSSSLASSDGTHVLVIVSPDVWEATGTTQMAVVNAATGAQIGTTRTLTGNRSDSVMGADGIHAL